MVASFSITACLRPPLSIAVLIAACLTPVSLAGEETTLTLDNGLRVTLIPAVGVDPSPTAKVAVVLLFDLGETHDPEGRAGLAHLVEHLYVTAAAGDLPARTAEEWFTAHAGQANAQTGRDYTAIATVAEPEQLPAELKDAAARLAGVRVEASDIERELPRLRLELKNMYGGIPALAARNLAQNAIDPLPVGARKGGVIAELEGIDLEEIRTRIAQHYVPGRARLIVAGAFDLREAREQIETLFGKIPAREVKPLPVREAPPSRAGEHIELPPFAPNPQRVAARLWAAPDLKGPDAATYLVFAAKYLQVAPAHGVMPIFTPIDDPRVFGGIVILNEGETAAAGLGRIDRALEAAMKVEGPIPRQWAERSLAHLLSLRQPAPRMIAMNPYLAALGAGRRAQLGLDRDALIEGISTVIEADYRNLRRNVLTSGRSVTIEVGVKKSSKDAPEGNDE
jgi:zinc protease